ncbi:MAG: protoporphyrinogen/coproporphyrinogen oxidase [Akkermansia sp.]
MMKYAVIGAGVSGLSMAGMLLKKGHEVVVYERDSRPGGLIKCTEVQGNLYHRVGGHVFNSRRQEVLDWFWSRFDKERDFVSARRRAVISLEGGAVVDYPIENHLDQFPEAVRSSIVHELLELYRNPPAEPRSLGEFFLNRFGKTLNSLYFTPYNNKVWRQDISQIAMDWLEDKLPMPSVAEILLNNIGHINESAMVHSSFFYAKNGGSQFLADTLARGLKVRYGEVYVRRRNVAENADRASLRGMSGSLGIVFPAWMNCARFPRFQNCAYGTTSVLCRFPPMITADYMPSPSHRSHRIICTGNFSRNNNNGDITTATIEFSEQMTEGEIRRQLELIPFSPVYLAHHWEEYTYPVQDVSSRTLIRELKERLEPKGIYLLGRFAEWEYYNMDAAMRAALDLDKRLAAEQMTRG